MRLGGEMMSIRLEIRAKAANVTAVDVEKGWERFGDVTLIESQKGILKLGENSPY